MFILTLGACTGTPQRSPTAPPADITPEAVDTDTDTDTLENRLSNPGFELGESWWRPSGFVSHSWARTGDPIYQSSETFSAPSGEHSQKIWGLYTGTVPNDSEHGLTLTELTAGDTHTVSLSAMTHPDDAVSGDNHLVVFLRFSDASGAVLAEHTSERLDAATPAGSWHSRTASGEVPEGSVSGVLGVRYHLSAWEAGGSVYLDEVVWTSTGTGAVTDERLLVWSDEFLGDAIDDAKWTHELLAPYTYNSELQEYTASAQNSRVEDGQLIITARYADGGYTSARLNTSEKADWQYGRFEGYLHVPGGIGTWPALWMLPTEWAYGGWPDSGEIDIMEHVGCDAGTAHGTVHTGAYNHMIGTQRGGSMPAGVTDGFHLYAVDWSPDRMIFTLDGTEYFRFDNDGAGDSDTWPFDQAFHFVINLAVGGSWGGYCGVDSGAFPEELRADWVRVYQ